MLAITIDGYSLTAIVIGVVAAVFLIVIVTRMVKRELDVRLTRVGVFFERERFDERSDDETQEWPRP